MYRRVLVVYLVVSTLCLGCASDRPSLADKVDQVNSQVSAATFTSLEDWYQEHPAAGFTLVVAGIVVVAAAAFVGYCLICARLHQPIEL